MSFSRAKIREKTVTKGRTGGNIQGPERESDTNFAERQRFCLL